jgi:hypothetical protein
MLEEKHHLAGEILPARIKEFFDKRLKNMV